MSTVATIRSSAGLGVIRPLQPSEHHLLRDHLLRLDPASRYDRFNGGISDAFITSYAARCVEHDAIVLAYIQDGAVRAAAELHAPEQAVDCTPELAFSVENRLRRQGVGSALFEQILSEARRRGYARVRITTGGANNAMRGLAYKFGADLTFAFGETTGIIDLVRESRPQPSSARAVPAPAPTVVDVPIAPPLAPLLVARDMIRASQAMWEQAFRLWGDLLKLRPRFGLR
ncbi:MAG: GNAT family N-acetyltransferase [Xanthobacteraceae bacterium]|nr:GNAT family N-acetyltransferase [Xanthobacteraceae bacterium]